MEPDLIEQIRDFNRFYTQRLGLLTDRYLGSDRALGPSRLLWEIGDRRDLRELRDRLGLDSGYLSRLLRGLEDQDLVRVVPHPRDGRARIAELTDAGRRERDTLDQRSRADVAALLDGLGPEQQEELAAAQHRIRRLLRLAAITITPVATDDPQAWRCLKRYAAELATLFPEGYDQATLTRPDDLTGGLLLARERDEPVGCGAWVRLDPRTAEIRHLWIDTHARGLGLGRRLLHHLESDAATHGVDTIRLGTHQTLSEAIALYRSSGYQQIDAYGDSPYNQLSFEKRLKPS
ncbi:helix-turn-helix domain-containing GNAT family N-acetyltransferase [Actinoplanes sichuanensis]|uniref:GNAT family N-acetyltransferase n=1 Tax=Actinoplanes sichuanensis TaxID=512349 RepID=A0ABW4ATS3_9ACTN|nr:MarR family winged helix-turn-helix transcriptional regulator [Actinoplanes sichuanensis]BEL04541.1 helix-turn-helix domain-containing GNAT family N-acetyltransferase [Actinoplanes sichuanensis]